MKSTRFFSIFFLVLLVSLATAFTNRGCLQPSLHRHNQSKKKCRSPSIAKNVRSDTFQLQALLAPHVWTSLLPPFLGFYKSEYTVSLGYGSAVALTAASLLRQFPPTSPLPVFHAGALIFYGLRLNAFLILRNIVSQRIQQFNTKVEERALARGNRWTTRAPFIASCGLLYYGLVVPLWFHSKLNADIISPFVANVFKALIAAQWFGFGIAAIGDSTKFHVKRSQNNENYLVTSGILSLWRHPNYSGELIGWTANAATGLVAASLWVRQCSITNALNLGSLLVGWIGIAFVLLRATSNLEARQKKEYGDSSKYQEWVASSWGGWQLPTKEQRNEVGAQEHTTPQIQLDEETQEESGTGI